MKAPLKRGMGLLSLLGLVTLVALSACSTPPPPPPPPVPTVKVVLLPQPDGGSTGVVVQSGGATQTLTQPYQRARSQSEQAPTVDVTTPEQVDQNYNVLFKVAPAAAVKYVLYFQTGGTLLTAESQAELPRIQAEANRHPGVEVLVVGHTDTKGRLEANDALSLRRAQQVRELLIKSGLPAQNVEASGRGERENAIPTADEVDEPRNRRVEILVR
jgi:outer membrane protein OmpA-like peptidoglycan-associated protein